MEGIRLSASQYQGVVHWVAGRLGTAVRVHGSPCGGVKGYLEGCWGVWASVGLGPLPCSEVQKVVNTADGLCQSWCELLQGDCGGRKELDWITNELRNSLGRSISGTSGTWKKRLYPGALER